MTSGFSVLMCSTNPLTFFIRSPSHQDVIASNTVITPKSWTVQSITDPCKRETYFIGEWRYIRNGAQGIFVVGVFERRLIAHTEEMVRAIQQNR